VDHRHAVRIDQGQVLTAAGELEVRVQFAGRIAAILVRRKNDEMLSGVQGDGRKLPLRQVVVIVGQIPIRQVDLSAARIMNFDPVAVLVVPIGRPTWYCSPP
jgi:hypothetical protein